MKQKTVCAYIRRQIAKYFSTLSKDEALNVTSATMTTVLSSIMEQDLTPFKKNIDFGVKRHKALKVRQFVQEADITTPLEICTLASDNRLFQRNVGMELLDGMSQIINKQRSLILQMEEENERLREEISQKSSPSEIDYFQGAQLKNTPQSQECLAMEYFMKCELLSAQSMAGDMDQAW